MVLMKKGKLLGRKPQFIVTGPAAGCITHIIALRLCLTPSNPRNKEG